MRDEEGSGEERGELDQKWDERDPRPKTPKHDEVEDDARRVERTKAREFSERQDDFAVDVIFTSKPSPMQQAPLAARKDAHRQRAMRTSLPLALALLATGLGCHKRLVLVDADSTPVGSVAKPVSTGSEASEREDRPLGEVARTPDAGRGTSRMALTDASLPKAIHRAIPANVCWNVRKDPSLHWCVQRRRTGDVRRAVSGSYAGSCPLYAPQHDGLRDTCGSAQRRTRNR